MTPLREAFVLPAIFLTVTLLGGLRIGDGVRLVPPPLSALVIAVALVTALVRGRVLLPAVFMHGARRPLENVSGAVAVLTLFAASAQAIHVVVPDAGLLHVAFVVLLFIQLISLSAAGTGRAGTLRSLFVLLGSAFVLRFVVLESLYSTEAGTLKRVLTALMAGVTLGGIEYQPHAASTGYIAFAALALYVTGLVLLPARPDPGTAMMVRTSRDGLPVHIVLATIAFLNGCGGSAPLDQPATSGSPDTMLVSGAEREAALAAARVWLPPPVPPGAVDFTSNPQGPGWLDPASEAECRLAFGSLGGVTPKFNCALGDGSVVKVKYGRSNGELFAEVTATRLLSALGFPADRMYVVSEVRCAGCPRAPFQALRCHAATGLQWPCFPAGLDYSRVRSFEPAVIERRLGGRRIESTPDQGWAWYELDKIDPARGGAAPAHVDALRLLAAFLAHWDNKAENQRLICPPDADAPDGGCTAPLAMLQDVGATFGPNKLDLQNWRRTPVWHEPSSCRLSMKRLPWGGGTFPDAQISEAGRQFLLQLLEQLSAGQVETLFAAARIEAFESIAAESRNPAAWAAVFMDKVRQIRSAGPCP